VQSYSKTNKERDLFVTFSKTTALIFEKFYPQALKSVKMGKNDLKIENNSKITYFMAKY